MQKLQHLNPQNRKQTAIKDMQELEESSIKPQINGKQDINSPPMKDLHPLKETKDITGDLSDRDNQQAAKANFRLPKNVTEPLQSFNPNDNNIESLEAFPIPYSNLSDDELDPLGDLQIDDLNPYGVQHEPSQGTQMEDFTQSDNDTETQKAFPLNEQDQKSNITSDHIAQTLQDNCLNNMIIKQRIYEDKLLTMETFKYAQATDDYTAPILNSPILPSNYIIRQGVLTYNRTKERLALPNNLIDYLFHAQHYNIFSKHKPISRMLQDIQKRYYNPNLEEYLRKKIKDCPSCHIEKSAKSKTVTLGQKQYPTSPREQIAFNIAGGFSLSNGYSYTYIWTDTFCNYSFIQPARTKSAEEILKSFKQIYGCIGGYKKVYSDREAALTGSIFSQHCEKLGIEIEHTAPPQPIQQFRVRT